MLVFMGDTLIELDDRRRASLGKLGHHQRYLAHEEPDGTLVFTPAAVMSEHQARLLSHPDMMAGIDTFVATPGTHGTTRPRPQRR